MNDRKALQFIHTQLKLYQMHVQVYLFFLIRPPAKE